MQVIPTILDSGRMRNLSVGDLICGFEPAVPATDTTNTTLALTAAMLLTPVYARNPAGVSTDTFPTAALLVAAMRMALGVATPILTGLSFRWRVINLSANAITGAVTANTGVTLTRGDVAASTTKDFLIRITNGTPAKTITNVTSVNASAVLSGISAADLAQLSLGMVVTNAVAGQQGNTIIGINPTAGTVTMSGNSNASASTNSVTFSPTYTITGLAA